jgi:ribosomal protein S18 acetylase RimI-like enzyme
MEIAANPATRTGKGRDGMIVRQYRPEDLPAVDALWRTCFPEDPPRNAAAAVIPRKATVQPELFLVAENGAGDLAGTVMAGFDGHRGWLHKVAVAPPFRRHGVATALIREAERRLAALGCDKVNLQVRAGNEAVLGLYRALGYAVEERVSLGKSLG